MSFFKKISILLIDRLLGVTYCIIYQGLLVAIFVSKNHSLQIIIIILTKISKNTKYEGHYLLWQETNILSSITHRFYNCMPLHTIYVTICN